MNHAAETVALQQYLEARRARPDSAILEEDKTKGEAAVFAAWMEETCPTQTDDS